MQATARMSRATSVGAVDGILCPVFAHGDEVPPCTDWLDLSSDRNLRPDPMEFFAHSVHGPLCPAREGPSARPANRPKGAFPAAFAAGQLPSRVLS